MAKNGGFIVSMQAKITLNSFVRKGITPFKFGTLQEDYDAGITSIDIQAEKNHAMTATIVFLVASLGYLGVALYVNHKKQEEYEKIKTNYNEALRKELGLSEAQIQDLMLPQTER